MPNRLSRNFDNWKRKPPFTRLFSRSKGPTSIDDLAPRIHEIPSEGAELKLLHQINWISRSEASPEQGYETQYAFDNRSPERDSYGPFLIATESPTVENYDSQEICPPYDTTIDADETARPFVWRSVSSHVDKPGKSKAISYPQTLLHKPTDSATKGVPFDCNDAHSASERSHNSGFSRSSSTLAHRWRTSSIFNTSARSSVTSRDGIGGGKTIDFLQMPIQLHQTPSMACDRCLEVESLLDSLSVDSNIRDGPCPHFDGTIDLQHDDRLLPDLGLFHQSLNQLESVEQFYLGSGLSDDEMSIGHEEEDDDQESDCTSETSESFWWTDYSEQNSELPTNHPLIIAHRDNLAHLLVRHYTLWAQQNLEPASPDEQEPVATGQTNPATSISTQSNNRAPPKSKSKRPAAEINDQNASPRCGNTKRAKTAETAGRLLACPFCKRDPVKWETCFAYTMKKISHVKQHLARVHGPPIYCPDCWSIFSSESDRNAHTRTRTCDQLPEVVFDCMSQDQKTRLKERVDSSLSEEDQWFSIFDVLFEGHPHPHSAYLDAELSAQLLSFREWQLQEGPSIIFQSLMQVDATVSHEEYTGLSEAAIRRALEELGHQWMQARNPHPALQLSRPSVTITPVTLPASEASSITAVDRTVSDGIINLQATGLPGFSTIDDGKAPAGLRAAVMDYEWPAALPFEQG